MLSCPVLLALCLHCAKVSVVLLWIGVYVSAIMKPVNCTVYHALRMTPMCLLALLFYQSPHAYQRRCSSFRSPGRLFVKWNPRSIRPTERYGNWHSPRSDPYVPPAFSKFRPLCSGVSKSFMCSCKKPSFFSAAGVDLQNIQVLQVTGPQHQALSWLEHSS
jgi:hypothetical protein